MCIRSYVYDLLYLYTHEARRRYHIFSPKSYYKKILSENTISRDRRRFSNKRENIGGREGNDLRATACRVTESRDVRFAMEMDTNDKFT